MAWSHRNKCLDYGVSSLSWGLGRERSRMDIGTDLLNRVVEILDEIAKIEKTPDVEANRMTLILSPR